MDPRTNKIEVLVLFVTLIAGPLATFLTAQTFDEEFDHWPVDLRINGRILIVHSLTDYSRTKAVLRGVASEGRVVGFEFDGEKSKDENGFVAQLNLSMGDKGNVEDIGIDDLKGVFETASVVVLHGGNLTQESTKMFLSLKPQIQRLLARGKTLIVDSVLAAWMGEFVLVPSGIDSHIDGQPGLNLIPNCILAFKKVEANDTRKVLLSRLALHPRSVGVMLDANSLLMLSGRTFTCHANGKATFVLMANEREPIRAESIKFLDGLRQQPQDFIIDLTEWRRDAIDRTLPRFPVLNPETPFVENGSLVIVGGGGMPQGLMERFIELAGGIENAKLVYVPCAQQNDVGQRQRMVESWKRMGVKHATFIHTKDRNQANTDADFMLPLVDATGIWFGGGRQWNFSDSYYGTESHRLMKKVLHRGGVIGGSSAGASIQGRYLARATPIGNTRIMAKGYERGGLGFLSGVAIDQHFSQRRRQSDMTELVNRYPQMLGIGLDEATAIVVQKSTASVVGRGGVHFYDRNRPVFPDQPDYIVLRDGSKYDLGKRKVLIDSEEESIEDKGKKSEED